MFSSWRSFEGGKRLYQRETQNFKFRRHFRDGSTDWKDKDGQHFICEDVTGTFENPAESHAVNSYSELQVGVSGWRK